MWRVWGKEVENGVYRKTKSKGVKRVDNREDSNQKPCGFGSNI